MGFDLSYVLAALPDVGAASLTNAWMAVVICVCALGMGIAFTVVRSLKYAVVNAVISVMISFVRGTPILIQIFLCYYVLPIVGLDLNPTTAGILAISLNSSVFITENFRGALAALDDGPIEAATALALKPAMIWYLIILPQLLRRTLPMLVSEGTVILKNTALLSVITVAEGFRVAQQIGGATFRPFEPLIAVALCFLVLNLVLVGLGTALERRLILKGA
jgi:polar amino acid transport system permease protein/cystine transport system permease protein